MGYTQTTLAQLIAQVSDSIDDRNNAFWVAEEIKFAIWEALYVWGGYTGFWKTRGVFNIKPGDTNAPYYDLSQFLPLLRPRNITPNQIAKEIQYHLLENPSGVAGTGMTQQVQISSILAAIQRGRDRFALDVMFPITIQPIDLNPVPPDGYMTLDQSIVHVHRAGWKDAYSGVYRNLVRENAWSMDKYQPNWTINPSLPYAFSESENSPLVVQVYPKPINQGTLELLTTNSETINFDDLDSILDIPNEWAHGVKYAALNDLFGSGMIGDQVRAQFAQTRYDQCVSMAKSGKSIIRLLLNNTPLNIDSLQAIDTGDPTWRNQTGRPFLAGIMPDVVVFNRMPDQLYGVAADVVQAAPIPINPGDYVQVGEEELANVVDYCVNYLLIKCGGVDLQNTFDQYDSFNKAVNDQKNVDEVKVQYLNPLLNQPEREVAIRPYKA